MNLGLIPQSRRAVALASMEVLFSDFIEQQTETETFQQYLDHIGGMLETMSNLRDIARTIRRHPSQEAIAVLRDAVSDLPVNYHYEPYEPVKTKTKSLWAKIKEMFANLWDKLTEYFRNLIGRVTKVQERLSAKLKELNSADPKTHHVPTWTFVGIDIAHGEEKLKNVFSNALNLLKNNSNKPVTFASLKKDLSEALAINAYAVSGDIPVAKRVVATALNLANMVKAADDAARALYKDAKTALTKAENDNDIATAKKAVEVCRERLKAASFIAHRGMLTGFAVAAGCHIKKK